MRIKKQKSKKVISVIDSDTEPESNYFNETESKKSEKIKPKFSPDFTRNRLNEIWRELNSN